MFSFRIRFVVRFILIVCFFRWGCYSFFLCGYVVVMVLFVLNWFGVLVLIRWFCGYGIIGVYGVEGL